jgi:hypothetical protein
MKENARLKALERRAVATDARLDRVIAKVDRQIKALRLRLKRKC